MNLQQKAQLAMAAKKKMMSAPPSMPLGMPPMVPSSLPTKPSSPVAVKNVHKKGLPPGLAAYLANKKGA